MIVRMFADIACPFEAHFRASVSEMSREKLGRRMRRDDLATVQAELLVLVHHGVPQRIMLATRCTAPRIGPKSQLLTEKNGFPISRQVYPSLMFSIHTASTGPSKTNHLRSSVWFLAKSRKSTATIPSTHSRETSSKQP